MNKCSRNVIKLQLVNLNAEFDKLPNLCCCCCFKAPLPRQWREFVVIAETIRAEIEVSVNKYHRKN